MYRRTAFISVLSELLFDEREIRKKNHRLINLPFAACSYIYTDIVYNITADIRYGRRITP